MRAVISDYVRTPFHRAHKGALANFRPEDIEKVKIMKSENLKIQRILDKFFEEQHRDFKFTNHQQGEQ